MNKKTWCRSLRTIESAVLAFAPLWIGTRSLIDTTQIVS